VKPVTALDTVRKGHPACVRIAARLGQDPAVAQHFVAVSSKGPGVAKSGIAPENTLAFGKADEQVAAKDRPTAPPSAPAFSGPTSTSIPTHA
jgi:hypothetical protein